MEPTGDPAFYPNYPGDYDGPGWGFSTIRSWDGGGSPGEIIGTDPVGLVDFVWTGEWDSPGVPAATGALAFALPGDTTATLVSITIPGGTLLASAATVSYLGAFDYTEYTWAVDVPSDGLWNATGDPEPVTISYVFAD